MSLTMPRAPLSPTVDKSMMPRLNGALSPLHTRRGTHGDTTIALTPDFATFDLTAFRAWLMETSQRGDLRSLLENADHLQEDLDTMLAHNIEHQKKIAGELAFQASGDYPPNDISTRLMPSFQLMHVKSAPSSCRNEYNEKMIFDDEFEQESMNSGDGFEWPPVDLPRKFWIWLRQYADPIDDELLAKWGRSIMARFLPENIAKIHEMGSAKKVRAGQLIGLGSRKLSVTRKHSLEAQQELRSPTTPVHRLQTMSLKRLASADLSKSCPMLAVKRQRSSLTSPKVEPLMDDLVKAYFEEQGSDHSPSLNGVVETTDSRKILTRKESILNGNNRNIEARACKKESLSRADEEGSSEDVRMNGHAPDSAGSSGVAECAGTLVKLSRALKEHLGKGEITVKHEGSSDSSDAEDDMIVDNTADGSHEEADERLDEVSLALKKSQKEVYEHEQEYRGVVTKVWNRLLAKYLQGKREAALNKACRELFEVYDKYFCEFPKRRPANEREREQCRAMMMRCAELSSRFYGTQKMKLQKD
uniref:Uncharacterized protein n=1 Tax=Parascaris univalens TaxID=6257 RepID=A0A915BZS9_PARUN